MITAVAVILLKSVTGLAQTSEQVGRDTSGVHFEQGLNWDRVLAKAKAGHKYIFVDCYATWCGPCKWMDANVYTKKEVGEVINKDFISIRLQMDRTTKDNDIIKRWYDKAKEIETTFNINAYPTLLFFDEDGKPVHRFSASLDVNQFLQLAADAQNPAKQYYAILKNFRSGILDTLGEKGLAYSFYPNDKTLSEELALDYLTRIPRSKLSVLDNQELMGAFQANSKITAIALAYIEKLNRREMSEEKNLYFLCRFRDNPGVQKIAKAYIEKLPEQSIYNYTTLTFLSYFTHSPQDSGFALFNAHAARIDTVMKDADWAQNVISKIIFNITIQPVLNASRSNNTQPDFDSLKTNLTKTYGAYYATRVLQDGKIKWYGYLVNEKKDNRYWPQLTDADIEKCKEWTADKALFDKYYTNLNDICYKDVFIHSDDPAKIALAVDWMKKVTDRDPNEADELDTYAVLLYKSGKVDEALKLEARVLQNYCIPNRKKGTAVTMMHTTLAIQEMWKGAKIWEEKEFIED